MGIQSKPMPRQARIRLPHTLMHIVQRGVNRSRCFYTSADRQIYLEWLEELADRFECAVHAYVLMTNHVHLLITPCDRDGVSLTMKNLGQRYVQYVNRVQQRTGGLWEGRFRASFVDREYYLMCCYRYIELNPVRAGLARHPGDYVWSSYRANAEGLPSSLIKPHPVFQELAPTEDDRRRVYRDLFAEALEPSLIDDIRRLTNGGFAIGNEAFLEQAARVSGRRVIPGPRGPKPPAAPVVSLISE